MKTLRTMTTAALLACAALGAHAAPLIYSSSQFAADAVAVAGTVADVDSKTSPPDAAPLVSSAVATSGGNFASALGFAGGGLLVAQSEASSGGQATSAVGTASFEGLFSLDRAGHLKFFIDLIDEDFTDAGQFSDASLFFTLTFEGTTYANLLLTGADDPFSLQINLPGAGTGMFSLLLASEASALNGNAANFAQAQFVVTVPEPGTIALLLGAGLVGWVTRRRRGERALTTA
ncbi:PEP-CTERM sorting domain-containing protein [Schlegelella sp. ID0723]|uniref:PEP-CTERM sorting domain-containing protein n=2 Tax=Piscinibacter koreensis TaxID=2742824 RepID=A0A7Y6TYS1_9BURK|nr:PEP-CTERM sorting domain-containing protein [Schlegelella koreensis]